MGMPGLSDLKKFLPVLGFFLFFCFNFNISSFAQTRFDPPRILHISQTYNSGGVPDSLLALRSYYINKGLEFNLKKGDVLNVYREKELFKGMVKPIRMFIGTLTISLAQPGSSLGFFEPNLTAISRPEIRFKQPIKNDIVVPRIVIDSSVLFDTAKSDLKKTAENEFDKVANFIYNFAPSKLIIEGHTDSDGDANFNQKLSSDRARVVKLYLETKFEFINPDMLEAKGYGEERPIVPNDSETNKTLNRRIEVIIWE